MGAITIDHVTKVYPGGVKALDDLSLTVEDGHFFALLGPSGCGKTTLLRTIAGLEDATEGTIRIGDREVTRMDPGKRDIAMVFQDYALFPHMDVADNIAYPLRIRKWDKGRRLDKARTTGEGLGLAHLMARRPGELSGGQQQRVALARAIATEPSAFLFDEPLSNLDARLRLEARTFLKRLQKELGVTTIFVTHDQAEALAMADMIAVMEAGQIRQLGTPREIFHRPATTFVANFIGSTPMNMLPGTVEGGRVRAAGLEIASPAPEYAGECTVGFRPEYTRLAGAGASDGALRGREVAAEGVVDIVENLGATMLVTVVTEGGAHVQAVVAEGSEPAVGDRVVVSPDASKVLVYGADGVLLG